MTREEAIEELKCVLYSEYYDSLEFKMAMKMAIQALSQEPTDAISRDAVKEMICAEFVDTQDGMSEWRNAVNDVVENLLHKAEQLPSVTQKSGKWIDDGFYAEGHSHKAFHCSKCGHNVLGFKEDLSKYCPNCGAKMESEEQTDAT